jgi:hypothetical protein
MEKGAGACYPRISIIVGIGGQEKIGAGFVLDDPYITGHSSLETQ